MTLNLTDIETALEERWEARAHNIRYIAAGGDWSRLGCRNCGKSVKVTVNQYGGWRLSSRDLDNECRPNRTTCRECNAVDQSGYNGNSDRCTCPGDEPR